MDVNGQNQIQESTAAARGGWRGGAAEGGRRTGKMHGIIATHLFMVIVFPLLQGLVDLSFPPQALDVIEERRGLGLLEED